MENRKPFSLVYVAKPEFLDHLCQEINEISFVVENLVFSTQAVQDVCFAADIWLNPVLIEFSSISEAAKILRRAGKYWVLHPLKFVRRSRLIAEQLPNCPAWSQAFPPTEVLPEFGCFSLLDKNTLVYATRRWKKWPLGQVQFIEDKTNPPNRAYLKLWEALSYFDSLPQKGQRAMDLGASPGGWTWVMQSLGTEVTSVDKAPLDPSIARLAGVSFLQQSAFALDPAKLNQKIDWLLGDIACYPQRLYALINQWIAANQAGQLIFTLKLQGEIDWAVINQFKSIPQARLIHLFYNKHEVCFFYPAPKRLYWESNSE